MALVFAIILIGCLISGLRLLFLSLLLVLLTTSLVSLFLLYCLALDLLVKRSTVLSKSCSINQGVVIVYCYYFL